MLHLSILVVLAGCDGDRPPRQRADDGGSDTAAVLPCGPTPVLTALDVVDVAPETPELDAHHATVGADGGERLVAWDAGPEPDAVVLVRSFGADLAALGPAAVGQVSAAAAPARPDVVVSGSDAWVVTNTDLDILVSRYADGVRIAGPVVLNDTRGSRPQEGQPAAAVVEDGLVVVWHWRDPQRSPESTYHLRHVSHDLRTVGPEASIATSEGPGSPPDVAALPGHGVVAVWSQRTVDDGVYLGLFDGDGHPTLPPVRLDEGALPEPTRPGVATHAGGQIAVTWRVQTPDRVGLGAWGRVLDAELVPRGPPFRLRAAGGAANHPAVAVSEAAAVFAWDEEVDEVARSWMAAFDLVDGALLSGPLAVDPEGAASARRPALAMSPWARCADRVSVTWESRRPNGHRAVRLGEMELSWP